MVFFKPMDRDNRQCEASRLFSCLFYPPPPPRVDFFGGGGGGDLNQQTSLTLHADTVNSCHGGRHRDMSTEV